MAEYRVGAGVHADRMRTAAGWRETYERNPWVFVAAAFAGGVLIAAAASGYRRRSAAQVAAAGTAASAGTASSELWERIKGALVAVAGAQLRRLLRDVIPSVMQEGDECAPQATASVSPSHRGFAGGARNGGSASDAPSGLGAATGH